MSMGPVVVVGSASVAHLHWMETLPLVGEFAITRRSEVRVGGSGVNQATAAHRLGAPVLYVGRVGEDDAGREVEADLQSRGFEIQIGRSAEAETAITITWLDDEGEAMAVGQHGANLELGEADVDAVASRIEEAKVVLAGGTIPPAAVRAALGRVPEESEAVRLLDLRLQPEVEGLFELADVTVTDPLTAERLTDVGIAAVDDALAALRGLAGMGAVDPVIHLGPLGAVCVDRGRAEHVPAPEAERIDAAGAEDAFKGALAAWLAEGLSLLDAVEGAVGYASLAVAERGLVFPDRAAWDAAQPDA